MNNRATPLFLILFVFALVWVASDRFSGAAPVASSDVTVRTSAPTVDDDISLGFLPGFVWIDQVGGSAYMLIDAADGAADWQSLY